MFSSGIQCHLLRHSLVILDRVCFSKVVAQRVKTKSIFECSRAFEFSLTLRVKNSALKCDLEEPLLMSVINLNEKKVKIKFVGKNMALEYLFFHSLISRSLSRIPLGRFYRWISAVTFNSDF